MEIHYYQERQREENRVVTIPYLIGAAVYYVALFLEVRKADRLVQKLKDREN